MKIRKLALETICSTSWYELECILRDHRRIVRQRMRDEENLTTNEIDTWCVKVLDPLFDLCNKMGAIKDSVRIEQDLRKTFNLLTK